MLSLLALKDQRIVELEHQVAEAQATIQSLREQIETLQRASKRQATPFARCQRVQNPKKAGRKADQGVFTRRERPAEEEIGETKRAALCGCPKCGSKLEDVQEHEQFEIDIPPVKPVITRFVWYSGTCPQCRKRVQVCHPDQISTARGAAGVVVGPRAKSLAADLKHGFSASHGKVSKVLNDVFGLKVSRGG